jgi:uncharacterized membrane protein YhaH (DUF805 family)
MSFGTAIATSFQKYSQFTGTSSRSEFWWFQLFLFLVSAGANALWAPLGALWFLAVIVPYLASGVRRLRDAGLPWGLIFIGLVPILGTVVVIVLWIQPTKELATPES